MGGWGGFSKVLESCHRALNEREAAPQFNSRLRTLRANAHSLECALRAAVVDRWLASSGEEKCSKFHNFMTWRGNIL